MSIFRIEQGDAEIPSWIKVIFTQEELQFLWDEININTIGINSEKWNTRLAGNIEKEYKFSDEVSKKLESIVLPFCETYYSNRLRFSKSISICNNNLPFYIKTSWVNFQKKHEFNPIHNHSGLFSFVIWLQIPYHAEDENKLPWVGDSNCPAAGQFQFINPSAIGGIDITNIFCSKSEENTMLVFPSSMHHCVYPFYTSDDYRITVSGNIFLDTTK